MFQRLQNKYLILIAWSLQIRHLRTKHDSTQKVQRQTIQGRSNIEKECPTGNEYEFLEMDPSELQNAT